MKNLLCVSKSIECKLGLCLLEFAKPDFGAEQLAEFGTNVYQ